MEKTVLIVTAMEGAENLARAMSRETGAIVELARSRRAALARLRRSPVTALLLDTSLSDAEMTTTDMVWQNASDALPIELNLSSLGVRGIVRVLHNLLEGRRQATTLARQQAAAEVTQEIHSTLTSLLLESELLLREKGLAPAAAAKARVVRELADTLRARLKSHSGEVPVALLRQAVKDPLRVAPSS